MDQWGGWVDLRYLRELRAAGFDVDYTDTHEELSWERVRPYDVLVIYVVPLKKSGYYDNTPDLPPFRDEFNGIVERFLESGGGVFLMARAINADESFLPLLRRWGARIPYERIVEDDPAKVFALPRMRGVEKLWFTDHVLDSPVSAGVEQVWLPLTRHYGAAETMPVRVSRNWRVVLRGSATSRAVAIDPRGEPLRKPSDVLVRREGVAEPELFAVREYAAGRIAFSAIWPEYSIGQGTEWLYERRVLDRGVGDRPSHFGRLIENTLRWLAGPALASSSRRGVAVDDGRLVEPNDRPRVRERYVRRSLAAAPDAAAARRQDGRLHRGLIGAQTRLGSGTGSVADHADAARRNGLDFVVFLEEFGALTPRSLASLAARCRRHAADDLALYPGYTIETNTGNHMFFFGPGVTLPPPELIVDGRLELQHQDPESGAYLSEPSTLIDWLNYRALASGTVNTGYHGFADRPTAMPIHDLRFHSMVGLRTFRGGMLVEDNLDGYLESAAGTLPAVPVAVHFVSSPNALADAAKASSGLTFARARSVDSLWSALGYAGQYRAPNVFTSDGPWIRAWPGARLYYTFAAERFAGRAGRMPSPISITSDVGLQEVRIYDGDRLFRRFLPGGARELDLLLELTASVQRTLVLVAEDTDGGRAVSTARRGWKGGSLAPEFCGDRVNDCAATPLLARGPGRIPVARVPVIHGGHTWDGGPRAVKAVMDLVVRSPELVSDQGREGERGFHNRARLELGDEGAVRVRSILERLYDPRVPVLNPWHTFGPLGEPTRLFRSELVYTEFERPSVGPHARLDPGFPAKRGAAVSIFEHAVTFLERQTVDSLQLFRQRPYPGPFPVTLVLGRGENVRESYELAANREPPERVRLAGGEWIGVFGSGDTNLSVHLNRGEPLDLHFDTADGLRTVFRAGMSGEQVRSDDHLHYELLTVADPVDAPVRGGERVAQIARRLSAPEDVEVRRGRVVGTLGLLELEARDGAVALRVPRPAEPTDVPLPVRVSGLNPRWSAGELLLSGYVLGNYGEGENRYRAAGFDSQGRIYATLFPDQAEVTDVVLGHPVVADHGELFIQVTRIDDTGRETDWHVSINNPTDDEITTTIRPAIALPGRALDPQTITIPAGGYLVLDAPKPGA